MMIGWQILAGSLIVRNGMLFAWWDIVSIPYKENLCTAPKTMNGIWPLLMSCHDVLTAKWIDEVIETSNIDKSFAVAVVPAQTLFYNINNLGKRRIRYLTVTWNDFMNKKKAVEQVERVASLSKGRLCKQLGKLIIIYFPTSRKTMVGSFTNFGNNERLEEFSQYNIEQTINSLDKNKCVQIFTQKKSFGIKAKIIIINGKSQ